MASLARDSSFPSSSSFFPPFSPLLLPVSAVFSGCCLSTLALSNASPSSFDPRASNMPNYGGWLTGNGWFQAFWEILFLANAWSIKLNWIWRFFEEGERFFFSLFFKRVFWITGLQSDCEIFERAFWRMSKNIWLNTIFMNFERNRWKDCSLEKIFEVNNGNCSLKWSLYILAIYKGIFIIFCIPQSFNW